MSMSHDVQKAEASRVSLPVSLWVSSLTVWELVASDAAFAHLANSTSNEFINSGSQGESHP
jgi:hypothetical protein